jgi:hypothetical protein
MAVDWSQQKYNLLIKQKTLLGLERKRSRACALATQRWMWTKQSRQHKIL